MKQLELNLQKRLLIVEGDRIEQLNAIGTIYAEYGKIICKGSELTEKVAEGLVQESKYMNLDGSSGWVDYKVYPDGLIFNPLKSFISAIEAQGYYWGENPVIFYDNENDFNKRCEIRINWEKSESRTFNPENTLIFEII